MAHVIAVGWDRRVYQWQDEKEEEVNDCKVLPKNEQKGHADDIMSLAYCTDNQLIYTGGHDGSLIAWNLETGYVKFYLHDNDPTCMTKSGDYILKSKSVDCIIILYKRKLMLSVTADQYMRFWDFDVPGSKQPVFTLYGEHEKIDSLSAVGTDLDNDYLVTGDTSGCLKLWNFRDFHFKEDHTTDNIKVEWFIQAHKSIINSIQIVEGDQFKEGKFIITASHDHNIHLHRFESGVFIGQFGQESMWNIHDLGAFEKRRPKFVRAWIQRLRNKRKEGKNVGFKTTTNDLEKKDDGDSLSPERAKGSFLQGASPNEDVEEQEEQEEDKFDDDYSDEDEDMSGVTIKNAAQYLAYKPKEKKITDGKSKNINEERYFKNIQRLSPKLDKEKNLTLETKRLFNDFKQKYKNNSSAFLND